MEGRDFSKDATMGMAQWRRWGWHQQELQGAQSPTIQAALRRSVNETARKSPRVFWAILLHVLGEQHKRDEQNSGHNLRRTGRGSGHTTWISQNSQCQGSQTRCQSCPIPMASGQIIASSERGFQPPDRTPGFLPLTTQARSSPF